MALHASREPDEGRGWRASSEPGEGRRVRARRQPLHPQEAPMRRFDDLEPDEMPEVLRAAVRDHEQERERDLERASIQEAATEMGLSTEHLDRAAAETHSRRVEEVRRRRRVRNWVIAAGVAALAAGGV